MPTSAGFLVEIDGSALPPEVEALMTLGHVDHSLRLPDLFELRFRDSDRTVVSASHVKIGSLVKISVATDAAQTPEKLVEGEVTALEAEFDSTGTFTVIRGYDQAHRLFRGRRTETYTQVTASDVATTVARRAGLKIGEVQSTSTVHDQLSQGGISDWVFLENLARQVGYEIAVRDGAFTFGKPKPASDAPAANGQTDANPFVLKGGTDLLRFRSVVTSADQVKQVEVRGWDVAAKKALVSTAPAQTKSAQLPTIDPQKIASVFGDPVHSVTDEAYRSQAEVEAAAGAVAETIAGAFAEFEGVARGNPKLRANAPISIENIGDPFDGKYIITSSRHRYDPVTGYTTAFAVTGRQNRSLLGLTGGSGAAQRIPGLVNAIVSDANDPQKEGRVRVKLPWLGPDYVSDWARTVQVGAGKDRGFMVVPEVDDEVLVGFEHGQLDRPYVLGGLYNGVDTPPTDNPVDLIDGGSGAVNRRSWVSRLGHRIDLLDQDGKKAGIQLSSKDNKLQVVVDAVGTTITVHSDGTITVEGKQGITIDAASSKLSLKAGQIEMSATSGVKIDGGSGSVDVNAGGQLSLKGTTTSLEGSAQTQVKSSGMMQIQGALVKIN
jgi:phage protein D